MSAPDIILASVSPYRRKLLARILPKFRRISPRVDESEIVGEPPDARALRLAEEKARAPAAKYPRAILIGGDQTLCGGGRIFDKPGNAKAAEKQLRDMRGNYVQFFTAVAVWHGRAEKMRSRLVSHRARFRDLSDAEIRRYVRKEPAFSCAGGMQIERLGVSLLDFMEGGDPSAVVGMPLLELSSLLRDCGLQIP